MKTKYFTSTFLLLFGLIFIQSTSFGQDDTECWCKSTETTRDGNLITVWNVDSLVANAGRNVAWKDLEGCEGDGCDSDSCTYKRKICFWVPVSEAEPDELPEGGGDDEEEEGDEEPMDTTETTTDSVKVCRFVDQTGDCTSETFTEDLPWDTTGMEPGPCNCVFVDNRNNYAFYMNVDSAIANRPDYNRPVEDGDCGEDCETSTCAFEKYNPRNKTWERKEGFCTQYWPSGDSGGGESGRAPSFGGSTGNNDQQLRFYPNPAHNMITISGGANIVTQVYSISGQLLLETTDTQINTSDWKDGVYVVKLTEGEKESVDRLIIYH